MNAPTKVVLGVAALLSAGCFRYVPVESAAVPPGVEVKMELTRVGFAELPELPNYSGPGLGGTFVRRGEGQFYVNVPVAVRMDGLVTQMIDQHVAVPDREIVSIRRRTLDRPKTLLAALGGVATLYLIANGFQQGRGNDTPEIADTPVEPEAGVSFNALLSILPW